MQVKIFITEKFFDVRNDIFLKAQKNIIFAEKIITQKISKNFRIMKTIQVFSLILKETQRYD